MPKGKFIVIDGTDGSGKGTQTRMLIERLPVHGIDVVKIDFPQYSEKSAGMVEEYLKGNYGTAQEVGPYRASIFYACDRYAASFRIREWLDEGKLVIANRYFSSNLGHQGGKIASRTERSKFYDWLYSLEFETFKIPKPDMTYVLHVDAEVAQRLVDKKSSAERKYADGAKRDIHEADLEHLKNAEKVYLEISRKFPDFELIECMKNDTLLSTIIINDILYYKIRKLLKK